MKNVKKLPLVILGILMLAIIGLARGIEEVEAPHSDQGFLALVHEAGFETLPVSRREKSIMSTIVPVGRALHSVVLLKQDDRVAAVFWYESSAPDREMEKIKTALFYSLDGRQQNIVDTPDRISYIEGEERHIILRVKNALYEFHISSGDEHDILIFP